MKNGIDMPDHNIPAELELYVVSALQRASTETFSLLNARINPIETRLRELEVELVGRRAVKGFLRYAVDVLVGLGSLTIGYLIKHYVMR